MGAVTIDILKKERGFETLNLADENVVRYLILFRDKVDFTYGTNMNGNYNQAGDSFEFNRELIALYVSLDEIIERCSFKEKELRFLKYLFEGYSISDVIEEKLYTSKTAYRTFDRMVEKINKINNDNWRKVIKKSFL